MVMARLHVICGNCGNADKSLMELRHFYDHEDDPDEVFLQTCITCKNCATMHFLDDDIKKHVSE